MEKTNVRLHSVNYSNNRMLRYFVCFYTWVSAAAEVCIRQQFLVPGGSRKIQQTNNFIIDLNIKKLKKKNTPNFTVVEQTTFFIFQSTIDIRARISCLQEKTDSVNCNQTHQWIWSTCIDQESCLCPEVSKYQTKLFRAKRYNYEFDDIKI